MKTALNIARPLCASVLLWLALLLGGCTQMVQSLYLASCDRDISSSTRAVETARDNVKRAAAYTQRVCAYSEKARYSRAFKLISAEEYERLKSATAGANQAFLPSIDTGAGADGCSCDTYNPLFALYTRDRRYDEAWDIVHKARSSKKWIAPELLDRLKKESGRSD